MTTLLLLGSRRARLLVERNWLAHRAHWMTIFSGFFEPVFYLFSIGVGIGELVGDLEIGGQTVSYESFVAPALLAASAMNGAVYDSTMNVFFKMKYAKLYDAVLATPMTAGDVALGEISWALIRGQLYATGFLVVMLATGLVESVWAILALPAAVLIGWAFAACGMAATSYMKSWQDLEFVQLVVLPLFLFSTTFYPLSTYPEGVQWVVQATPLYHGVTLVRGLTTGAVDVTLAGHAAYLVVMGLVGLRIAGARLQKLLLH
ncbi:MAG: ABC transporter permease [Acidimicrobiales bacterium]